MKKLIDLLSKEEIEEILFEEYPFETESCSQCSHHTFGDYDGKRKLRIDGKYGENGEIHCCTDGKEFWEMAVDPCAEFLTAKDALEYEICGRYDGPIPFTKEEAVEWIEKRKQLIKEMGFEPGEYFKENAEISSLLDFKKLEFGNLEHIAIKKGDKKIPIGLISSKKLSEKLKKILPSRFDYSFPNSPYSLAREKWKELQKTKDKKTLSILSEGIATYLTKLNGWTIEDYSLGSSVLNYLVRPKECEMTSRKHGWYSDLYKNVSDLERKKLVKKFVECLAGVSYSIAES